MILAFVDLLSVYLIRAIIALFGLTAMAQEASDLSLRFSIVMRIGIGAPAGVARCGSASHFGMCGSGFIAGWLYWIFSLAHDILQIKHNNAALPVFRRCVSLFKLAIIRRVLVLGKFEARS